MVDKIIETVTDAVEGTVLGQRVAAPTTYTPEILVRVPRAENRDQYGIDNELFVGEDHWYCYECSTLTKNSVPVYFGMVITVPANSKYIVESKSLKLYLNSFNMTKQSNEHPHEVAFEVADIVASDLSKLLEAEVKVTSMEDYGFHGFLDLTKQFTNLESVVDYSSIELTEFNETPELLQTSPINEHKKLHVYFNGFRSNCKVTHQPDYATVFIEIATKKGIDPTSLVKYLSSFRNESHFHEECVEAIFKRLTDKFEPSRLFVRANYTRRGGIDINPTRCSYGHPSIFTVAPDSGPQRHRSYDPSRTKYQ